MSQTPLTKTPRRKGPSLSSPMPSTPTQEGGQETRFCLPSTSDGRYAEVRPERPPMMDLPPSQRSSRSVTPASARASAASSRHGSPMTTTDRPTIAQQAVHLTAAAIGSKIAPLLQPPQLQRDLRRREKPPPSSLHTSYENLEVRPPEVFDTVNRVKIPQEHEANAYARALKRQQDELEESPGSQQVAKRRLEGRPYGRRKRRGGRGRTTDATGEPTLTDRPQSVASTEPPATTITVPVTVHTTAPPKEQRQRRPRRPRSTGTEITKQNEPSEVPVVAASKQRTKAKPATSERAPMATERGATDTIEQLIQLIRGAFVSKTGPASRSHRITRLLVITNRFASHND
ncbi:hypothetical protein ACJJTC_011652 [Scirpophaga incertulas]